MKITVDLEQDPKMPIAIASHGQGEGRASAKICLKTLKVLKSRNFSGSQLMAIEQIVTPLAKAKPLKL
jgi:hypothetical protein